MFAAVAVDTVQGMFCFTSPSPYDGRKGGDCFPPPPPDGVPRGYATLSQSPSPCSSHGSSPGGCSTQSDQHHPSHARGRCSSQDAGTEYACACCDRKRSTSRTCSSPRPG